MATSSDYKALGTTGLNRQGGRIYDEYLRELQGDRWKKVVREMTDSDPIVGAILFSVEMMLRQVEWTVMPFADKDAEPTPEDDEIAQHVEDCLYDMAETWDDTLSEILTMLPWGFAPLEATVKRRDDGRVGWATWSIRSQDTVDEWVFNEETGEVLGFWQMAPPKYQRVFIPLSKCLLFRTTSRKGNPEGRSVLRNAYRPWYFKKNIENVEGIGIERDLAGLPVAQVPPNILSSTASADELAMLSAVRDIVTNIRRDEQEGIVWPLAYDEHGNELFKLTLLSTGGTRQFDTDKIIARYDQRIAMTMLADFILLGHENVGSFSLSSDKTNLFATALSAWLDSICATVNRFAIPKLLRLNGWDTKRAPELRHGDIERISMTELADYIQKLTGANVILPDEELEKHVRQQADLPEAAAPRKPPQTVLPQPPAGNEQMPAKDEGGDATAKSEQTMAAREFSEAALLQGAARILARGW
jgi:hypothetical protein